MYSRPSLAIITPDRRSRNDRANERGGLALRRRVLRGNKSMGSDRSASLRPLSIGSGRILKMNQLSSMTRCCSLEPQRGESHRVELTYPMDSMKRFAQDVYKRHDRAFALHSTNDEALDSMAPCALYHSAHSPHGLGNFS